MSSKKRVFDKELGVELVLDDSDERTEIGGKKRAKFEPTAQQTASTTSTNTSKPSILSRLGDYATKPTTNVAGQSLKLTEQSTESHNSDDDDDDDEGSENYEDIDYGDDDDEDDVVNDDENFDNQLRGGATAVVARGQEDLRSRIGRNNYHRATDSDDGEHKIRERNSRRDHHGQDDGEGGDDSGDTETDGRDGNRDDSEGKEDEKASSERCKYWPSCKAGNECTYYHPSKPCRTFPNCRFGQSCLYAHPPCKFNPNCTRPGCQFAHPMKSSGLPGPSSFKPAAAPQPSAPKCRYGFNCSNLMCKFSHQRSEPCRFGANCLLESCAYTHPADQTRQRPTSVFKWSAQQ